jgi:O-antigen ligase
MVFVVMLIKSNAVAYGVKITALSVIVVTMSFLIGYLGRSYGRLLLMLKVLLVTSLAISGFGFFQVIHFYLFGDIPPAPFLHYFPLPHEESLLHRAFMWYIPERVPRIMSIMTEPNSLGLYLAIVLFINAWVIKYRSYLNLGSRFIRLAKLSSMAALVPFVMTFSRSGWLTLVVGLVVLALGSRARTIGQTFFFVLMSVACLVLATHFVPEIGEALLRRITLAEAAGHIDVRVRALEIFSDAPLLGVGFGNYGLLTGGPAGVSSTHSYYITYLVEGGLLGGLAFLVFALSLVLIFFLKNGGKLSRDPLWLLGFGLTTMIFINNIFYHTFWLEITWIAIGISFAALYIFSSHRGRV